MASIEAVYWWWVVVFSSLNVTGEIALPKLDPDSLYWAGSCFVALLVQEGRWLVQKHFEADGSDDVTTNTCNCQTFLQRRGKTSAYQLPFTGEEWSPSEIWRQTRKDRSHYIVAHCNCLRIGQWWMQALLKEKGKSLPTFIGAKSVHRSVLQCGDEFFWQMFGQLPCILCWSIMLPLYELFRFAGLISLHDYSLNFVNTHNSGLYHRSVFR